MEPEVVTFIKLGRLCWRAYTEREKDDETTKRIIKHVLTGESPQEDRILDILNSWNRILKPWNNTLENENSKYIDRNDEGF